MKTEYIIEENIINPLKVFIKNYLMIFMTLQVISKVILYKNIYLNFLIMKKILIIQKWKKQIY